MNNVRVTRSPRAVGPTVKPATKPVWTVFTIRKWMAANHERFRDPATGEVNTTLMVETWDLECCDGAPTLNPNHPAWDIAVYYA